MFKARVLGACAFVMSLAIPQIAHAQCYACAIPTITNFAARMGSSPGAWGAGAGLVYNGLRNAQVRYPPGMTWQPYSRPPGYYRQGFRSPGVWYPSRRW